MGVDYEANLLVGMVITWDEVKEAVGKKVPEVSHMETRWDTLTGEKHQVKVIDQEGGLGLFLDGKEIDRLSTDWRRSDISVIYLDALVKKLNKVTGATHWEWMSNDGDDDFAIGLTPKAGTPQAIVKVWPKVIKGQAYLVNRLKIALAKNQQTEVFAWLSIS